MIEDLSLTEETYVVFDLETTGLYPNSGDSIIEIGAVKIKDGKIVDVEITDAKSFSLDGKVK